jgi:hypothetical protein
MPANPVHDRSHMMRRVLTVLAIAVALPQGAIAQSRDVKKSQLAHVDQTIADTRIELTYRRPVARGRTLFGGIVPWRQVWTPSADTAVVVTASTPITVNGASLPAGTYSLWAEPDSASWTIIFSANAPVFHLRYPRGKDVLRVTATPRSGPHMETLAFYFPIVDERRAELVLHWGTTIVPLSIEVP